MSAPRLILRQQRRALHITGPATFSAPLRTQLQQIQPQHPARPFDTAPSSPPPLSHAIDATTFPSFAVLATHFSGEQPFGVRVPIVPSTSTVASTPAEAPEPPVMRAEILATAPDSVVSPMADVHDNSAVEIDFLKVADSLGRVVDTVEKRVEEYAGPDMSVFGSVWKGFVEDVFGKKGGGAAGA